MVGDPEVILLKATSAKLAQGSLPIMMIIGAYKYFQRTGT
jgi:hypothetical protein